MKISTSITIIILVAGVLVGINLISLWFSKALAFIPLVVLSATSPTVFTIPSFTAKEIIIILLDILSLTMAVTAIYVSGKIKLAGRPEERLRLATVVDGISATLTGGAILLTFLPIF